MTRRTVSAITALLAVVLLVSAHASAQEPARAEIAVGYSVLHDWDLEETFPVGWVAAAGFHLNKWVTLVGDASGHYKSIDIAGGQNLSLKEHAFLGGPRARYSWTSIGVYGQVLFGATHGSATVEGVDIDSSDTAFTVQTGLGIDFFVSPATAIRVETGGRFLRNGVDAEASTQWRMLFGVVRRIGR
jgi:Outer membrane protein beta-barrel domain